jgi:hypothetical protein
MKHAFKLSFLTGGWLLLAFVLPAAAQKSAAVQDKSKCLVAEIRGIAFSTHHPSERYLAVSEWLKKNGPSCSLEKLQYINGNRPNWFGHADSPALGQLMDQFIEVATGSAPKQAPVNDANRSSLMASAGGADAPKPIVQNPGTQAPAVVAPVVAMPPGGKPTGPQGPAAAGQAPGATAKP